MTQDGEPADVILQIRECLEDIRFDEKPEPWGSAWAAEILDDAEASDDPDTVIFARFQELVAAKDPERAMQLAVLAEEHVASVASEGIRTIEHFLERR